MKSCSSRKASPVEHDEVDKWIVRLLRAVFIMMIAVGAGLVATVCFLGVLAWRITDG